MPLLLPFLLAFIAGALAVLVFHQSALGLLHLVGLTPRTPFVLGSVPPLGVPQLLSLMFWGGVWGLALLPLLRPLGDARCWLRGLVLGASLNGVVVRADEHMVRKVLNNLVSNAIKYGSSGGSVELEAFVADGRCRLTVRDHGPGIAAAQIDQAFGSFVRLGDDQTGESGMGIGLTMSRSYVEQMGGTLELESTVGEGTTAVMTLPVSLAV